MILHVLVSLASIYNVYCNPLQKMHVFSVCDADFYVSLVRIGTQIFCHTVDKHNSVSYTHLTLPTNREV